MKASRIGLRTVLAAFACAVLAIGISIAAVSPPTADARDADRQYGSPAMEAMDEGCAIPSFPDPFVYSGYEIVALESNEWYEVTGTNKATDVGTYTATATLRPDGSWEDGTTDPITVTWEIKPKPIPRPQGKTFVYDGTEKNALGRELVEYEGELWLPEGVTQVSLGNGHSAAVTASGDLYMWGRNSWGELGDGTTTDSGVPIKVLEDVVQVSLGAEHSAALTTSGDLYMWGNSSHGRLGVQTERVIQPEPVKVLENVVQVSLGFRHSAAVTASGDLYMWGSNANGQTGDGSPFSNIVTPYPTKVLEDVVQVSLGSYHSAAVTASGDLYTWGSNGYGQLGDGTTTSSKVPIKVLEDVAQVSLGSEHSAVLTTSGDLYTWGRNDAGQLGDGTTTNRSTPVKILEGVVQVSLGFERSAALTASGDLYTWGCNDAGQLGDGTTEDRYAPVKVLEDVIQVSLGDYHSAAVTASGDLYTWGANGSGELGDGTTTSCSTPAEISIAPTTSGSPLVKPYERDPGDTVTATDAGSYHCYAEPGPNYCWSDGTTEPVEINWSITPARIAVPDAPELVYSGAEQTAFEDTASVRFSGQTSATDAGSYTATASPAAPNYAWADGSTEPVYNGQIGDGTTRERGTPTEISIEGVAAASSLVRLYERDPGDAVAATDAGSYRCFAEPGPNYTWADGTTDPVEIEWSIARKPIPVPQGMSFVYNGAEKNALGRELVEDEGEFWLPEGVAQVSLGKYHSAAVTVSGDLYTWGNNDYGQLGDGTTEDRRTPVKVLEDVVQVALGHNHSAAVTASGDLYMWGYNYWWLDGATTSRHTPVKILENVVQVSLGYDHSAALTSSGDLYTWRNNDYGQIGDGTDTWRSEPVKVLENVTQVSLGTWHSAAVTASGDLYTWGLNYYGQLGDGTTVSRYTPVKIMENVTQVSLGDIHSAAVTATGDLYTWGCNWYGQLGDSTEEDRHTPVKVLEDVVQVSLGEAHSAAATAAGDLYTWGHNGSGRLGDGTEEDHHAPVKVLEDVVQMSLGNWYSAAVTTSGDLFTWGRNDSGQLGDGTTTDRHNPVEISIVEMLSDSPIVRLYERDPGDAVAATNAGSYHCYAEPTPNYCWADGATEPVEINWSISKAAYDMSGVSFEGAEVDFDGGPHSLAVAGELPAGVAVSYEGNGQTEAGTYTVTARFSGDSNHEPIPDMTATLTIKRAAYDMSGVSFEGAEVDFDGAPHSLAVAGELPAGVAVAYEGNGQTEPGVYTVTARFSGDANHEPIPDMTATLTIRNKPLWTRLGGNTRYDTMATIVKQAFPETSSYAVLVSGANFPDALSAASLAGAYGCPVVSTKPSALSAQAKRELERLGVETVFIVGGPKAVSPAVEESVRALNGGTAVERVFGSTRYNTALEVMKKVRWMRAVSTVFVATGKNFPDALAASPFAYAQVAPIVLIDPAKGITAAQLDAIKAAGAYRVIILGGPNAVPDEVDSQIRASGIENVSRLAGSTRYATSVEIAKWATANGADFSTPVVATGLKDADALVGAPLAGRSNSVLLLADEKNDKGKPIAAPAVDYLGERAAEIRAGYILGGENAVSASLADRILAATNGTMAPSPLTGQEAAGGEPCLAPGAARQEPGVSQLDGPGSPQLTAAPIG